MLIVSSDAKEFPVWDVVSPPRNFCFYNR